MTLVDQCACQRHGRIRAQRDLGKDEKRAWRRRDGAGGIWAVRRKLAPDQLVYARRMIVEGEGRAQVARSLGVDPSTLRRLLMKGS
jgi:DNA invertase Pin-like site-specific DNA recombinase